MVTVMIEKGYVRTSLKCRNITEACNFIADYGDKFESGTDFIISMDPEQDKEETNASDV